jgi:hypothetical protein
MKSLLLATFLLLLSGCTDPNKAAEALKNLGLGPITVGGYDLFACSEDDFFHTHFTAKRPDGKIVSGTVCAGWFKGQTVRFD